MNGLAALSIGLIVLIIGLVIGSFLTWLWLRPRTAMLRKRLDAAEHEAKDKGQENETLKIQIAKLEEEHKAEAEKTQWAERAREQLRQDFETLSFQALRSNADELLKRSSRELDALFRQVRGDWNTHKAELEGLFKPLETSLNSLDQQSRELERKREGAYQGLQKHLDNLAKVYQELQTTTISLSQALRSSEVRGRWGELQLRRIVEMAGMTKHVDFEEQAGTDKGRPDMIVRLPNEGILPVDAKAPMLAYLKANEEPNEEAREKLLKQFAQDLRNQVRELASKAYWQQLQQFGQATEVVVMFVPIEACLSAVFERDPELLEFSLKYRVLLATPVTLLALLKAVAYGWQQQQITENAREIAEQGKELHERLRVFIGYLYKVGKSLNQATEDYNEAVGSLESRVFPSARKFKELGAVTEDLPELPSIERKARFPGASESQNPAKESP